VGILIAGVAATGVTLASAPARHAPTPRYRGLSKARVLRDARGSSRVIVVMRSQHRALPATRRLVAARVRAVRAEQAPLVAQVARSGGSVSHQFTVLNGFSARVSKAEAARLSANRAVAQVVPDAVIRLPQPANTRAAAHAAAGPTAPNGTPVAGTCPTDPSKPLLEPEALQTTHTAFSDPSTPQAQQLATGSGVKVAFFADGLDINNPDFIRPDGSHVFIDYQDFSGDGPNGVTGAAEAFGDASSIAAQGRQVYDISKFNVPQHPLPANCNITVRGISPGASLIGMKVFGNSSSSFDSTVLQGLDYAVSHDHADVLSESFGEYPIPDTAQDLTREFNSQAAAAGITVVESTGDSGVESSVSSATSDPSVIAAGASTNFRGYAQGEAYAFQFSSHSWLSDNVSSIESAGPTQEGRELDLVAPGEVGWALCSANVDVYEECTNFAGDGSPLQQFGGTSESAPFIAGGAALVIQGYRDTHAGHTPSPALVKQLLTSTANDLGFPSFEQGAGEMDTLSAVQAARSVANSQGTPAATGSGLLIGPTQLDLSGEAGTTPNTPPVTVTNVGSATQIVHAHTRALTGTLADKTGTVNLNAGSPTFIDQFGLAKPYQKVQFSVPAGADRLVAYDAWPGPNARVGLTLIDPNGDYAAYTRPQGNGNHGEVDVRTPVAGNWTAIVFLRDGTFTGPVHYEFTSQQYGAAAPVSPSALTLAPGQTGSFRVGVTIPRSAGDSNQDLVLDSSGGKHSVVPIALRSLVNIGANGGSFSGMLVGGNGRAASPGQLNTFDFNVPAGKPELGVTLTFSDDADTSINGTLIDPDGQAVASESTSRVNAAGNTQATHALQAYHLNPRPGRWRFVVDVTNPVGGNALSAPYSGHVTFSQPKTTVSGLPNSASTVLPAGQAVKATVKVTNGGPASEDLFLDPRLPGQQDFPLLSLSPDKDLALPLSPDDLPPLYLMPTQTTTAFAAAQATRPVTFDWGFGDPHLLATPSGNTASGQFSAREASPGVWFVAPTPVGPFSAPITPGKVSTGMVARTKGFDFDATPASGDVWQQAVDPNAPAFAPVTVGAGKTGSLKVTLTPSGRRGKVVRGTLYVDDFSTFLTFGNELLAIPYEYTVG
jgi:hypothetical protein